MTNQEIITFIDDLIRKNLNYCDFMMELKKFQKTYKKTIFYKTTRINLYVLVEKYQLYKLYNLDSFASILQTKINELDLSNFTRILNQFEDTLAIDLQNNQESLDMLSDLNKVFQNNVNIQSRGE